MRYNINYISVFIISLILAAIVFFWLFGVTGILILIGICLFWGVANLCVFNQLPLETDEKFFFGFFISFVFFPMAVWYVGRVIPSFRVSIIVVLILVLISGLVIKKIKGDKK